MIKTKTWIIAIAALLLLSLGAMLLMGYFGPRGTTVQILQDGVCLYEIDLSRVEKPYTLNIPDGRGGSNTVRVEQGRICIEQADGPDQVGVRRGWLGEQTSPIVCLPHRLVIQILGEQAVDGVAE